ncbi:MAG: DinB family protein [Pyrinomonadaceae bacterium]
MLKETLIEIYERDLQKVIGEIKLYKTDEDLWKLEDGISNSGGNLALHLIGNINHFFGANLGKTGYKRERDLEFSDKNISRDDIVKKLENTILVFKETLSNLSDEDLHKDYPEELGGKSNKTLAIIIHMLTHLNYHLGQINYHRRFFSN